MREIVFKVGLASLAACTMLGASAQTTTACNGAGCGFGGGGLLNQQTTLRLTAGQLTALLNSTSDGQQLLQVAGAPQCDIEIVTLRYRTVGGAGEAAIASAALMIPGGKACSGPRPTLLYAHGTTAYKKYNLADITQTDPRNGDGASEGISVAAMYAAQGYIVVASNYAGYAGSDLDYHPYLNGAQQSADMVASLQAARVALYAPGAGRTVQENGKLFVTGYSQGGYVAMATHRLLQASGIPVTASAPGSGPYALAAMGDALAAGQVGIGSTVFAVLVTTSYQRSYQNLYRQPSEFYESAYAPGIASLLPSMNSLDKIFAQGKLPTSQLFNSTPPASQFAQLTPPNAPPLASPDLTPVFALGFGSADLVRNGYRLAMLEDALVNPDGAFPSSTSAMAPAARPTQPLRVDFKLNDLRNWQPRAPVLLCGGHDDPTVFFFNATVQQAYWRNANVPAGLTSVLDVDDPHPAPGDPFAAIKNGFLSAKLAVANNGGASAVMEAYHATLVAPFCMAAARGFFGQF
ncbi:MAG: alpha/beta hydrolase [Cupriavidus sp.]|nr:alpha/beta hydrolase [Cupriavidus sp.]